MFSFFKKKDPSQFVPTKKVMEAAIIKGKKIGLSTEEIIEMASLMDKEASQKTIKKIVNKALS